MLGYNSRIRHKIGKFNRRFSGDPPPASTHHTLAQGYLKKVAIQLQFVCWALVLGTGHCTVGNVLSTGVRCGAMQYVIFWHWQPVLAEKGCFFLPFIFFIIIRSILCSNCHGMQDLQLCIFPVWIVRGFPECSGLGRVVAVAVTKQMWRRWCGIICECKICYLCSAMACHCSLTSCLATIRWNIISPDQTQCPGLYTTCIPPPRACRLRMSQKYWFQNITHILDHKIQNDKITNFTSKAMVSSIEYR